MIRFAAISSTGKRGRASTRHEIDKWAAEHAKAGESVEVFAREPITSGEGAPILVGRWEPVTW